MNPNSYNQQLEELVNHFEIDADWTIHYKNYNWSNTQRKQGHYQNLQLFQEDLANILYSAAYVQPAKQGKSDKKMTSDWMKEQQTFISNLSEANQSHKQLDSGWTSITAEKEGYLYLKKDKYFRQARAGTYLLQQFAVKEGFHNSFYYAYGDVLEDESHAFAIRLYFNLIPEGCAHWIKEITSVLNHYRIPFTCKCLTHPDYFDRSDTAVLYLYKPDFNFAYPLLKESFKQLEPFLAETTPLFTKKLDDGIAFAESPPISSESFGTSRCAIIAEAITQAVQNNLPKSSWLETVQNRFQQLNFDLENLHLNPESQYPYIFSELLEESLFN